MKLVGFDLITHDLLRIHYENGQILTVCLDKNSGRGIWRKKINSLMRVRHTGIYLGRCLNTNTEIAIHNHYQYGSAYVTSMSDFARNEQVFWLNQHCENSPIQTISNALNLVKSGEKYKPLSYNCQTMVNSACNNQRTSQDVSRIISYAACTLLLGGFIWAIGKVDT